MKLRFSEELEQKMYALTTQTRLYYYQRCMNLLLCRFKWNLEGTQIDERFLEWVLLKNGNGLLFYNTLTEGYVFTPTALCGDFDINEISNFRKAYSISSDLGSNTVFSEKNSVVCWNNRLRSGDLFSVNVWVDRLTNVQRVIDTVVEQQRNIDILITDDKQRATMLSMMKKLYNFVPFVVGRKSSISTQQPIQQFKPETGSDKKLPNLMAVRNAYWEEFLTFAGYNTVNREKKERQTEDEVNANNGEVYGSRYSELVERKEFCRKANKLFGLNLNVEWRNDKEIRSIDDNFQDTTPILEIKS